MSDKTVAAVSERRRFPKRKTVGAHSSPLRSNAGFSLMELMIVLVIVLSITAAIFQTINLTTQRSTTEQTKLDMFQEAREFMDQMSRDLRQAGYPSPRNMDYTALSPAAQSPFINDHRAAGGLIEVAAGDLWFEGDVDGSGTVSVVRYHLDTSTTNNCPCLRRSQAAKADGAPLSNTSFTYQVEVQGVQNTNIFSAYNNGAALGLPVDISAATGSTIAGVDTVQATLSLQASTIDPQTRQYPTTTLVTTVRLNNCSQAAIGYKTSCN
jgi:prepilin-type N-terminal cleavage/methylation domain-containing protein